jgi:hypothetical protein
VTARCHRTIQWMVLLAFFSLVHGVDIDTMRSDGRTPHRERVFLSSQRVQSDRPELKSALDYLRAGNTLIVWKPDRLARSVRQPIETMEHLQARRIVLTLECHWFASSAASDGRLGRSSASVETLKKSAIRTIRSGENVL